MNKKKYLSLFLIVVSFIFIKIIFFSKNRKPSSDIIFLGESTTFQGGKNSYTQLTVKILEEKLFRPIKFKNLAISGTSSSVLISRLRQELKNNSPKVIVAMMGINDTKNVDLIYWDQFFKKFKKKNEIEKWLLQKKNSHPWPLYDYYFSLGDIEKAKEILKQIPYTSLREQKYCQLYRSLQERELAITTCKKAAQNFPQDGNIFYSHLVWMSVESEDWPFAESVIHEAQKKFPKDGQWATALSWVKAEERNFHASFMALEKSRETLNPNFLWYASLAGLYHDFGKTHLAILAAHKASELSPQNFFNQSNLFQMYVKENKIAQASSLVKRLYKILPRYILTFKKMERLYLEKNVEVTTENDPLWDIMPSITKENWLEVGKMAKKNGATLVIMGYPFQNLTPLYEFLDRHKIPSLIVENNQNFSHLLKDKTYDELFRDAFAGFFGHFRLPASKVLAQNLAHKLIALFGKSIKSVDLAGEL